MEKFFAGLVRTSRMQRSPKETEKLLEHQEYLQKSDVWEGTVDQVVLPEIECSECHNHMISISLHDRIWENVAEELTI